AATVSAPMPACTDPAECPLKCLDAKKREDHHPDEQETVAETRYLRFAIGARRVSNRDFYATQVKFGCAKDQIKIAERIKIAEIAASCQEALVIRAPKHLCAAQRIGKTLIEQP